MHPEHSVRAEEGAVHVVLYVCAIVECAACSEASEAGDRKKAGLSALHSAATRKGHM